MICTVAGVQIQTDKLHHVYKPSKGAIDRLLKLGKHAPRLPPSEGTSQQAPPSPHAPSSAHGLSSAQGPSSAQGLPPSGSKKKSVLNFISQGLFACFNVGKHNAQEIRSHRQYMDEQLLKLETRQKTLLAKNDIEHSPVREPMVFPPPVPHPYTTLGRSLDRPL